MITGASALDGEILVIEATDGVMPQTKEHLTLTKQLGVKDQVIFLTISFPNFNTIYLYPNRI